MPKRRRGRSNNRGGDGPGRRRLPKELKHPKHLHGREIGLWYRDLKKRDEPEESQRKPMGTVNIPSAKATEIYKLLDQLPEKATNSDVGKNPEFDHIPESEFKTTFLETIHAGVTSKLENLKEMNPDEKIDEILKTDFNDSKNHPSYQRMSFARKRLPVYKSKEQILTLINENQVVIISGETGCGKTTQIPQYILEDHIENDRGSMCRIICSQPRRISAISVAERVAEERGEHLGESVGYKIRLESQAPREHGSIIFCTTGIIIKLMESNFGLDNYSHLILDEIHERDVMCDFILAIVKCILTKKPKLKIVLMSATLNAEKFANYFNVNTIVNIPGFTYEVKEYYLEDVLLRTGHKFPDDSNRKYQNERRQQFLDMVLPHVRNLSANKVYPSSVCRELIKMSSEDGLIELAVSLVTDICLKEKDMGSILVFLTGYGDISKMHGAMEQSGKFAPHKTLIIPLHSQMATAHQKAIFEPAPHGVRKIILSTNIAETSITIDDVVFVIDCGRIKCQNFDAETNEDSLRPQWVSLANANQRRGRAGRVKPGICYHLFSRARMLTLDAYQKPELLRTRLDAVILNLKILRLGAAADFLQTCLDPPDSESVDLAVSFLKRLNALDDRERLTPLGYHLARLPVRPQIGKMMLLGCLFGCLDPVLNIATTLDFKDPFLMPLGKEALVSRKKIELSDGFKSDHLLMMNVIGAYERSTDKGAFCWDHFLSQQIMKQLLRMKGQFTEILHDLKFVRDRNSKQVEANANSNNVALIKAIICASLYPNVFVNSAKIRKRQGFPRFHTLQRKRLELHPKSILTKVFHFESPFLVYFTKVRSTGDFVHDATIVNLFPLIFFGDRVKIVYAPDDDDRQMISVNDTILLKSNERTVRVVLELRKRLNEFLEEKACNPGCVNWDNEEEVVVLKAIRELVTIEDEGFDLDDFQDEDNNSD